MNHTKIIKHLVATNDLLITMFKESELRPIKKSLAYHSPDELETDEENATGKRKIVTKDLAWCSATVSKIDRFNYFDIN